MEPPFKRQRLSGSSYPEVDLDARRAQNDLRLKSIFESIFDKYGRDFDGIGDEIDMETGEIVVNNGHILGMTNERDVGDAEYASEELGNTYDEDDHSSLEDSEDYLAALQPSSAGDAAVSEEPGASEPSEFDADSLMGDVPAESFPHTMGKKSRRAVSIPPDDEEDELASSDIEWASYSKDRLGAQGRWCLLNKKPAFVKGPAVEPAWIVPPLPKTSPPKREREEVRVAKVDNLREYSDDERANISLWTPEVKKHPQRRHESANLTSHQSMPFARSQENNADRLLSKLSKSKPVTRKKICWTKEEEELLVHLKTTTDLTNMAMVSYFPERQYSSVASHWVYMIAHGKASPKLQGPLVAGHRTPSPSLSPSMHSLASDETGPKPHDHETFSKAIETQSVRQKSYGGSRGAGSLIRTSSKSVEHLGDHQMNSRDQVSSDRGTSNGYPVDESILISDDVEAHTRYTMGEPFLSARGCERTENSAADKSLKASEPFARTSDHYQSVRKVQNCSDQSSMYRDQKGMRRTKHTDRPEASVRQTFDAAPYAHGSCKVAEPVSQVDSSEDYADTNQSCIFPKSLEVEDDISRRRTKSATNLPEQEIEVSSKNGYGARVFSSTVFIKAEPDLEGAEPYGDGIASPEIQPRRVVATEASNPPKQLRTSHSIIHQEDSNPSASEDIMQSGKPTAEGRQKTASTKFLSLRSAQPLNHGKLSVSNEPTVKAASKSTIKKQNVQVVIPMAATAIGNVIRKRGDTKQSPSDHPHITSPLATTETENPDFIRQLSAIPESAPAALDLGLPHQEVLVIRPPTRSPSNAAESQHAASAAFVLNDIRSSLGPEIADSQPLSSTPVVATPASDLEAEATRPVLDAESQSLRMTPGVAPAARKQSKKSTNSIVLDSESKRLRVAPEIATPARKRIEEAIESDIVESGSHPPAMKRLEEEVKDASNAATSVVLKAQVFNVNPAESDVSPVFSEEHSLDDFGELTAK